MSSPQFYIKHTICTAADLDFSQCRGYVLSAKVCKDSSGNLKSADNFKGPSNSWGIHGLWPDNCDGTYSEDCDSTREYTGLTALIKEYGSTELLNNMNTYWNSDDESNEEFWEHEWATHGTCVTTLDPTCYTDYETGQEAVDFFQIVVDLFLSLVCLPSPELWTRGGD